MSYTRPAPNAVSFDWSGEAVYTRPAPDAVEFNWAGEVDALFVVLLVTLPVPPILPSTAISVDTFLPEVKGTVTDAMGNPAGRRVRVFERSANTFIGETISDPVTGEYQVQVHGYGEYQRIVLAEDESDPLLNDLIDRIRVEWPEA